MATMRELVEHPELATQDDINNLKKIMDDVHKFGESIKGYNVKIPSNNSIQRTAEVFYQEYLVMAAILEAFVNKDEIDFKEMNQSIFNYLPCEFLNNPITFFQNIILKMMRIGYIEAIPTEDIYLPRFKLTADGISALKNQTFHALASTSFFSKQTFECNKKIKMSNIIMIVITVLMLLITSYSLLF